MKERIEITKIRKLGSGSFGVVFLVDVRDEYYFGFPAAAMKSALLEHSSSLLREEAILAELIGNKEIVQLFDSLITLEGGRSYYNLFMEYAPGGTLLDHMKNNYGGKLPESVVRNYTRMLLKGLKVMHEKGIVHCDLKPTNILVFPEEDGECQLKIADFGLSKVAGEEKIRGFGTLWTFNFRGTPRYMSPESVERGEIEPPLDIWSLGCVVIEMLTGLPAWQKVGKGDLKVLLGVKEEAPRIPPTLSETCKDFLGKCFAAKPGQRWTADMLLNHSFILQEDQVSTSIPPSSCPNQKLSEFPAPQDDQSIQVSLPPPGWCSFSDTSSPTSSMLSCSFSDSSSPLTSTLSSPRIPLPLDAHSSAAISLPPPGWCSFSTTGSLSTFYPCLSTEWSQLTCA